MNSLEDAFININLETDKYLHNVVNKEYTQSFFSAQEDHQQKQDTLQQNQKQHQDNDHLLSSFVGQQQQQQLPQLFQASFQHSQDISQSVLSNQNQLKVPFLSSHQILSEFIYQDIPFNNNTATIFQSNSSSIDTSTTNLLQISAIIIRRAKYIYRSWVNIIALIIPFLFLCLSYSVIFSDPAKYEYFSVIITIQFTLCFQSSNYMNTVIYEKHNNIKNSLRISGCTMKNYWLATIITEVILSLIFLAIIQIMFTCMGSEYNVQGCFGVSAGEFFLQTSMLALTNLAQTFLFSGLFNSPHEASLGLPCLQMITTEYVGYILIDLQNSSIAFFQVISFIPFLLNPAAVMGYALIAIPNLNENERKNLWFGSNVRSYYIFAGIVSLVFIGLTVYLEYNSISEMLQRKGVQSLRCTDAQSKRIDNDVFKEDQEVVLEQNKLKYPIKAHRLKKVFPNNYIAINKISFGVEKKQIFGLLGPNGAGKSTTFNILTSSDRDYRGQAQVNQEKVKQKNEKIWANAGVCPQQDVLWENLTVMDHFQIHATLKGLRGQQKEAMIDYFLTTMQLSEHQHKKTKFLSGGNKRKLSVCLSILGGPRILFLDEPTSGIDPITKRFLWHALQQTVAMNDSSIVLTTHSMQEAQFLCNKIGILINGQFACMGSSDHLARKYGNGYRLSLKIVLIDESSESHQASQNKHSLQNSENNNNSKNISSNISNRNNNNNTMHLAIQKFSQINARIAHIDQKVLSSLPDTQKLTSRNSEYLTYQITEHTFRFSVVFSLIDQLMRDKLVQDYTLHHANLEQIFQFFAGFQSQFIEPPLQEDRNELCDCQSLNSCRWCCLICCGCVW